MYGAVTKYVLKPRHALTRVSSAPHLHRRPVNESDNIVPNIQSDRRQYQQQQHQRPPDQHYGTTITDRQTSSGDNIVVIERGPVDELRRTKSELPQSKVSVYAYNRSRDSDRDRDNNRDRDIDQEASPPDESTRLLKTSNMDFIAAYPSNDTLPILLTLAVCMGSFLFGFHIGFSSPFEQSLQETANINRQQSDLMFSLISIGAIIGALTSGPFSSHFGRKTAIFSFTFPYIIGTFTMVFLYRYYILLCVGRTLIGMGVGASSVLVPLYVAEIAPPSRRGSLGSTSQFLMSFGLVVVNAGGIPAIKDPQLWTLVLLCSLIPLGIMIIIMLIWGVETPRYLMSKQQTARARRSLRLLRGAAWDVEGELNELMQTEEVGLGSVEHSKEALRAWMQEYAKYFKPEAEEDIYEDIDNAEVDISEREREPLPPGTGRLSVSTSSSLSSTPSKSFELPSPQSVVSHVPPARTAVPASPSLKSSLLHKHPGGNGAKSNTSTPTVSTATSGPSDPSIAPSRDKKTVRMWLPDDSTTKEDLYEEESHHEERHSIDNNKKRKTPSSSSSSSSSSVAPSRLSFVRQASDAASSMLERARSAARRAFPSQLVNRSASTTTTDLSSNTPGCSIYLQRAHLVPLLLGVTLQLLQQWSGINAFMFHLKSTLQDPSVPTVTDNNSSNTNSPPYDIGTVTDQAQADSNNPAANALQETNALYALYGAIAVNALQMLMGAVMVGLMEKAGRRIWLMISCLGMSCAAFGLSYACYTQLPNPIKIGLVMSYVTSFALGVGPLPWLICSEIFPAAIRSQAVSIATTVNWTSAFIVTATYPLLEGLLSEAGVYTLYSIVIACGFFFVLLVLPETGGKSLEEIEDMFDKDAQRRREEQDSQETIQMEQEESEGPATL